MTILLDTHVILWAGQGGHRLSAQARAVVAEQSYRRLVSAASAWEIATKVRIGKLQEAKALESDFVRLMDIAGFERLDITLEHALRSGRLPGAHRDPFDRLLAAQALALDIPIVSSDTVFEGFGVRRLW